MGGREPPFLLLLFLFSSTTTRKISEIKSWVKGSWESMEKEAPVRWVGGWVGGWLNLWIEC